MKVADLPSEIADGADPEGARVRFERFIEQGGVPPTDASDRRLLAAILSSGTFLPELLLADLTGWSRLVADAWLTRAKPAETIFAEVESATRGAADFADFKRRLRLVRRREMLRLGARELGWGTTEEVAAELSGFADACLELSYRFCDAVLRVEYGTPVPDQDAPISAHGKGGTTPSNQEHQEHQDIEAPPSFVVMAMGKLGGGELNFSSDVDLIYFYSTDAGHLSRLLPGGGREIGRRSLHQYFAELSRRITEALEEVTAEGFIFRVDLRLRPEGRAGPLCNSLAAAERYYETFGRTWERQALLRARPCAGDQSLGTRLLEFLDPFIYPRHIAPGMLNEIRALRAQFVPRQDEGHGFDVKLGGGGIRDVELVVQMLQLLHAGKRRDLRGRSTPRGLRRLEVAGLLSSREARTLGAAYRFWRQVEHRLQLQDNAQTQLIPAEVQQRTLLARRLGFPAVASFDAQVAERRSEVMAIAATFGNHPAVATGNVLRLLGLSLDRAEIQALLAQLGFSDLESSADLIETVAPRLSPEMLAEAAASADPDRALANFRDLTLRGALGPLTLLREDRQLMRMVATLFGISERLSRLLIANPALWEPLVSSLGEPLRGAVAMSEALDGRLQGAPGEIPHPGGEQQSRDDGGDDEREESAARAMRRFAIEETLSLGLHDVAGNLRAPEVARQLTDLAEVCLERGVPPLVATVAARYGWPTTSFTILGLGSFGGREMRYGSDLDLVFLYAADGETSAGVSHQEFFSRLARRMINSFGATLEEGRLYEIDTRLRPSGAQGLLVTSQAAFERYHQQEAASWERVALLRARVVFTNAPPEQRAVFDQALARITHERPFDPSGFNGDLRRIRERVQAERGRVPPGSRHLRFDPGGIMDVEFLTALGQLEGGAADLALRTTETTLVLARLVALGWPSALLSDYALLRSLALRMRLLRDRPEDVIAPDDLPPLARSLDQDPDRLRDELDAAMERNHALFIDRFPAPVPVRGGKT